MAEQLSIQLVDSSFWIDVGQTVMGGFKIQIRNDSGENIPCKVIKVKIPYGDKEAALTNSNDFEVEDIEYWSEPRAPFDIEGASITIPFINDGEELEDGITDTFNFYKVPFSPNPDGIRERNVNIVVECYANEGDVNPTYQETLSFTIKNQGEEPIPFVNYFALESLEEDNKKVTIVWNISHGKEMMIYPRFLTDQNQLVLDGQARNITTLSDQDSQPILIGSERPIKLTQSTGRLELELLHSTQFTLTPDNDDANQKWSQVIVYIKELTVINFDTKEEYDPNGVPYPYLKPLTLNWIITFANKKAETNRAYLLIREFDNNGQPLPLDRNSESPPVVATPTRAIKLDPKKTYGSITVYPVRKTEYTLYISENLNSISKTQNFTIMTTSGSNPIGSITMIPSNIIPIGWRLCDSGKIKRIDIPDTFDELAKVLGQTNNNGVLTLPSLVNRFPCGAGSIQPLKTAGGPDPIGHTHRVDPPSKRFRTSTTGSHGHSVSRSWRHQRADNDDNDGVFTAVKDLNISSITGSNGNHNHTVDVNIPAVNSGSAAYSKEVKTPYRKHAKWNRPFFYSLNFIIRVS